jgi:choline dehydrogenase-like flavoprotein
LASDDRTDVLVIGAGAAGAAVAWMLARAGIGVVCLEQGDWVDPRAFPHWRADWELHRHTDWSAEPNVRRLPQDYPINDAGSPIAPLMYNAVGGSTIHWSAHFPRFRPSDFRARSLDGVADDWPIDYATLEPFFDLNDRMMGVAGITGDPAYPPKAPRQTPPIPLDTLGATMARGFDRLGWHWWPSDSAILTRDYDGRRACINCGPCDLGCPTGAKASTDITYWPKALAAGARLRTRARVREITIGPDGRADGAVYHDGEGRLCEQKARAVVMAANGIGTPRLLLNSRSARFPDGLANRCGLVGRNLMFHPYAMVRGVFDRPLGGHRGPIGCSLISQEFYETDLSRGFVRGYSFQVARGLSPIASASEDSSVTVCLGVASTVAHTTSASTARSRSRSSPRTCPSHTTAWTSIPLSPTATGSLRPACSTPSARTVGACSITASHARARHWKRPALVRSRPIPSCEPAAGT